MDKLTERNVEATVAIDTTAPLNASRKRWLGLIALAVAATAIAYGGYWTLVARYLEKTDNAYVGGNVVQITPQVAGTVVAIGADDTQFVKAGQVLVRLDKADSEVALQQAESQLAKTVRDVRNLFASSAQQQANVEVRQADLARAQDDLARRERLAGTGAISKEEAQHARDAVKSAQAGLAAAQQQLAATRALVDRTSVEQHPDVQHAAAAVKDAYLAYARTALPAPVAGFIAKRNVQLGQRVSPGTPLMAVVPLEQVWVDANFKEAQLAGMRAGQPVALTADIYGGKIVYHGKVSGFGAGTGAAFALLPAQNASGNWIKIVQRVPVRIALDPQELAVHPLQIGLSMQVEVDTHDRDGDRLPQVAQTAPVYQTDVFEVLDKLAETRVKDVVAANRGGDARPSPQHASAAAAPASEGVAAAEIIKRAAVGRAKPL
jgi:membrane fusion protein (multidrug efflux system)